MAIRHLVALAMCAALAAGSLGGCAADSGPTRDPNMHPADAELLDYINAYYDDYQNAVSLDEVPSDVVASASEELARYKELIEASDERAAQADGDAEGNTADDVQVPADGGAE